MVPRVSHHGRSPHPLNNHGGAGIFPGPAALAHAAAAKPVAAYPPTETAEAIVPPAVTEGGH